MTSKIFLSILKSILMIIPIPIGILLAIELVSIHMIEETVGDFETSIMTRLLGEVESDFENTYATMVKVKNDENLIAYVRKPERDFWEEKELQKKLEIALSGQKMIKEIYIYFEEYDYVLSTSSGIRSVLYHQENYKNSYEEWMEKISGNPRGKFRIILEEDSEGRLLLVSGVGDSIYPYKSQIVFELNDDYIRGILEELCFQKGEEAFLLSSTGVLIDTHQGEDEKDLEKLIRTCVENKDEKLEFGNAFYNLRYKESVGHGLTLVYASPHGMKHTAITVTKTIGFVAIIFCAGLLIVISFVVANKNYSPILYLFNVINETEPDTNISVEDYSELENYVRNSVHTKGELRKKIKEYENDVKSYHLGRLLFRGKTSETLDTQMKKWGFSERFYAVLLCVFEGKEESEEVLQPQEESWQKDLLEDYVQEYFGKLGSFYILEENRKYYCLLNGNAHSAEAYEHKLTEAIEKMKKNLIKSEGFNGEVYVSGQYEQISELHKGYEEVKRKWEDIVATELSREEEPSDCSIERIIETIHNNIADENLSVTGIADQMRITSSYLSRFFKLKMGMGVLDYIHQYRIERAKEMLASSEKVKIKEVATTTGFYNISTFIRVFKKIEGMTPGQYQEMMNENK